MGTVFNHAADTIDHKKIRFRLLPVPEKFWNTFVSPAFRSKSRGLNNSVVSKKSCDQQRVSHTCKDFPLSGASIFPYLAYQNLERQAYTPRQSSQYGPTESKSYLYSSKHHAVDNCFNTTKEPSLYIVLTTYVSYLILIMLGHIRDIFGKFFRPELYRHLLSKDGYAPLNSDFEEFYVRRLKARINDCFSRPTIGVPGRFITLLERVSYDNNFSFCMTGKVIETLNLASYNYLGFAQSNGPCADAVELSIQKNGVSTCSSRLDVGSSDLHLEVEELVANFVGKPAAVVYSMGFSTNASVFPALVGKGCLILSDELNHSSIRNGARLSGAVIEMFRHNDVEDLEKILREAISQGQPRTHRPWRKILVVVEGLYSMEGTMCNLPGLVELKTRYKFHLFIDEAHSIGALGPSGRGVCDYFGVNPSKIDILMGTLTKSFGANGGYIAADHRTIAKLRIANSASSYAESPSPSVLCQIGLSIKIITGTHCPGEGLERLQRLAFNSRYLRLGLKRLGFIIYGHDDSPIIPLLLYNPAKMSAFSHEMLQRRISVVVVGYPATPLISSRARLCVSAAHSKSDLDWALKACDEVGDILQLKFSSFSLPISLKQRDGTHLGSNFQRNSKSDEISKLTANRFSSVDGYPWKLEDVISTGAEDAKHSFR